MRILIAENQEKVRYALSVLVTERLKWTIVGSAENSSELLGALPEILPDVLLLDDHLPGLPVKDLVSEIRQSFHDLIIIWMSSTLDYSQIAIDHGADYFVSKVDSPNKLLKVLRDCESHYGSVRSNGIQPVV